jgi:uncharacterized protein (DUF2235 family)
VAAAANKTIVLLSDGTGNSSAMLFRTNVWRIYEALDVSAGDQVAYYDDGVGTSSFKLLAILGGAFGWGLKRNVRDLYSFLCRNYEVGDRIFAFGFSRGAFTIRVLIDMIADEKVIVGRDGADLANLAAWAYRRYRGNHNPTGGLVRPLRFLRDIVVSTIDRLRGATPYDSPAVARHDVEIAFVGLWDTVSAYGLPIQEMTRGWDEWVWPLSMDDYELSPLVKKACHALSLDDDRQAFHPLFWDEKGQPPPATIDDERITQVWFAGVHSNVGGGYSDDGLSFVPLKWIAGEARKRGLQFHPAAMREWNRRVDVRAPISDPRAGLGGYYRYSPRRISQLIADAPLVIERPKVHVSVFERILSGVDGYAPIGLPETYAVVTANGSVLHGAANPFEQPAESKARDHAQERIWNLVWIRRGVYFATVGVSLLLALSPLVGKSGAGRLDGEAWALSRLVGLVGRFLPAFVKPWIDHYQQYPLRLVAGGSMLAALLYMGAALEQRLTDVMRTLWASVLSVPPKAPPRRGSLSDLLCRLRMGRAYSGFIRLFNERVFPTAFGVTVLFILTDVIAGTINRAVFEAASGAGLVCHDVAPAEAPRQLSPRSWGAAVPNNELCHPTGIGIDARGRYRVEIQLPTDEVWKDAWVPVTSADGFTSMVKPWVFYPAVPFRRALGLHWFVPIVRVGATGFQYHVLSPAPAVFVARRSGPLFFFVNDAVMPLPAWGRLYENNTGARAWLIVTREDAP